MPSFTETTKRFFLGRAVRNEAMGHTLLPKRIALPVFASDALSSNAYATQEILLVLSLGGAAFYSYAPWVAGVVVLVFFTVAISYRQNVHAYPNGGGAYEVVAQNMGQGWGVFAASALMVDYILTVAVSIAAAIANLVSAFPGLGPYAAWASVGVIVAMTLMNLRGVRESGTAFALPTYAFIFGIFGMLGWAIVRMANGATLRAESADWTLIPEASFAGLGLVFLLARAFSSGTTALTGMEAISNGVPAFRKPKSKNAATTLLLLGLISMTMFSAITWLALQTHVHIAEHNQDLVGLPAGQEQKQVIAQIADAVFGTFHLGSLFVSITTALILALAANTAFNGFPVLGSILARDGFLPRQLHTRGDRLAYSNGIIVLAGAAALLVYAYDAQVNALIQMYIIGVFVSFTLSQYGMVRHWNRLLTVERDARSRAGMHRARAISGFGAVMTALVLVIVLSTKFLHGAWIVCLTMPLMWMGMRAIRRHYDRVSAELELAESDKITLPSRVHAIVLVSKIHKPTLRALAYARATRPSTIEGVTVSVEPGDSAEMAAEWNRRGLTIPLKILDSPYREVTRPIVEYVRGLRRASPRDLVTVYIPEYVVGHWWENLLHNQSALRLKTRLRFTPGVMVVSVPWQLLSSDRLAAVDRAEDAPGAVRRGMPSALAADAELAEEFGDIGTAAPPDPAEIPRAGRHGR